ncbi:serine hydrolase [Streptomyces roseirectus]|uniref:Serine hydrolase n=1 Tax=Streptomyces roseirectus TaxID=2768066 RepID=A0A7H0ILP9_9ACTN|nr:serine hydrolase [Streptomyces roseirectus]QNP73715.1 serine hydrolase [Streptomyces roseirectus]
MESSRAARRHRARASSRRRPILLTALAVLATAGGTAYVETHDGGADGVVSSAPAVPSTPAARTREGTVTVPETDHTALLKSALEAVSVPGDAAVAVGVLDLASGESAVSGEAAFDTASIVKVDILAALLLQAQDAGRRLTGQERAYAAAMIEYSDNDSASALWNTIGQAEGLDAANERFGMSGTEGGEGALWGLTRTTAADQLVLLRQVFGEESELSQVSREYVRGLMAQVRADQGWGVSAAARGAEWAVKNGWLARSTTGLWDVNSIGRVAAGDGSYLVAVLSDGNVSMRAGISLVEEAARAAVGAFTATP